MDLAARIQACFRENASIGHEAIAVPPFTLFFHGTDKSRDNNFALPEMPVKGAIQDSLRQIQAEFARRGCTPRVQFLEVFAPALPDQLKIAGYYEAKRWPIWVCTPAQLQTVPEVPGLEMVTVSAESSLAEVKEAWDANALGYDLQAELATNEQAELFREGLTTSRAFTARLNGQMAGAGMFNPIHVGVTELVGITTLEPFRRRGIATFLTAFATQAAFAHGANVAFLTPENEPAGRVYERVGYRLYGTMVVYEAEVGIPNSVAAGL
jgi:GNAT superfamily N-acetyltransferase